MQEPDVLYYGGRFHMWYTAGWRHCAVGYATSRDGIHWNKYAGNPVIGLGRGGWAGQACHVSITRFGGALYAFWADPVNLRVSTSFDGVHWWTARDPAVTLPTEWAVAATGNTAVWKQGGHWEMIYEAFGYNQLWQMGVASAPSPFGPWLVEPVTLNPLQVVPAGMYGGPDVHRDPTGGLTVYYHAADVPGDRWTSIYKSSTTDLVSWTPPELVETRSQPWQVDQVADPSLVQTGGGHALLYMDGVDNHTGREAIGVALARN